MNTYHDFLYASVTSWDKQTILHSRKKSLRLESYEKIIKDLFLKNKDF